MINVTIHDNGAAFMICADGTIVHACNSLGDAWRHIVWMYMVASQRFTVGKDKTPVVEWMRGMYKAGYLDDKDTMHLFKTYD